MKDKSDLNSLMNDHFDKNVSLSFFPSFFGKIQSRKEMEYWLLCSVESHLGGIVHDPDYIEDDKFLGVDPDTLRSNVDTKEELEGYDIYDVSIFKDYYSIGRDGFTLLDITPYKKLSAIYFPSESNEIADKAAIDIYFHKKQMEILGEEKEMLAYRSWWDGKELKKEGFIKEAAELFEISIANDMPREEVFSSLLDCYRKLKDQANEYRIAKLACAKHPDIEKFQRALDRVSKKIK